ncbi:MAG: protein phosphatase 2C domain-containing protein [Propionibacteriaceae bacterium]|nr:protein phosphatase 2C domain-containing protein [Propionibacteriaceae bacterium]
MEFLDYAAVTHPGTVKPVNEDRIIARAPVFLVADGISGCGRGALASGLVAEHLADLADAQDLTPEQVADAVEAAHRLVREDQDREHHKAATTVAAAVALWSGGAPYWTMVNAGDSRIYRVTGQDRRLVQITEDHTHVQAMVELGLLTPEEAADHPERHVVTNAVGSTDGFTPDYWLIPIVPGDRLLLCSDGLLEETDPGETAAVLQARNSPQDAVVELLTLALRARARDNVSIIVVDVDQAGWGNSGSLSALADVPEFTIAVEHP